MANPNTLLDDRWTNLKPRRNGRDPNSPFCVVASKVLTLFKSSHKQHNHDEAISADRGLVLSRPPSVVAKLMGLEALPDSATTNKKQEMGVTPISPPFYAVTSKVDVSSSAPGGRRRSNVQPNDDQHREAVGEVKKATYRGTQVSREVSLIEPVSGGGGDLPPGPLPISATTYDTSMIVYLRQSGGQWVGGFWQLGNESLRSCGDYDGELPVIALELERLIFEDLVNEVVLVEASHDDSMQVIKDQWEMPDDVIPNTLSFGVSLHEEDDGLKTILWEEELNRAESWTDYDGELPVIALELERLIFEDLVNEVVLVEASHGKRIQPRRCRRRLSSK
ncbi:longifolia 1-like protein [Tanacetum coccineum]